MSKRRKVDKFYQEWHIKRNQANKNTDEEWTLPCPRPLQSPASGKYHAIEIHSIEYHTSLSFVWEQTAYQDWCITTSPRTGQTPFSTDCGDPSNLWFHREITVSPTEHAAFWYQEVTRLHNIARYTDEFGHGKLIIGQNLYLQCHSLLLAAASTISLAIEYTWATVSCDEYAQELQSQLSVG